MDNETSYHIDGPVPETPESSDYPNPWQKTEVVGTRVPKVDGYERVSGTAVYPHDVSLPEMLHGAILRCPHAHAKVKRVSTGKAEKMAGVRAVIADGSPGSDGAIDDGGDLVTMASRNADWRTCGEDARADSVASADPIPQDDVEKSDRPDLPCRRDARPQLALCVSLHQGENEAADDVGVNQAFPDRGHAAFDCVAREVRRLVRVPFPEHHQMVVGVDEAGHDELP